MNLLDGKTLALRIRQECATEAARLKAAVGIVPGLAVILAGENPASQVYVGGKEKACLEAGYHFRKVTFPASVTGEKLKEAVRELNADPAIHGVLVQLPLPEGLDEDSILEEVSVEKDVDGIHPASLGRLVLEQEGFLSCTPQGVMVLLEENGVVTEGKHAVVLGRSRIVGKPMALLLSAKKRGNATVTMAHSRTKDLAALCRTADILVAAIGRPKMITKEYIKPGAVVVDVGINRIPCVSAASGTKLCGDVDFDAVKEFCSRITPVPGGVGPMTIAMLLRNTLRAAQKASG